LARHVEFVFGDSWVSIEVHHQSHLIGTHSRGVIV
jgi:hypothetical protein